MKEEEILDFISVSYSSYGNGDGPGQGDDNCTGDNFFGFLMSDFNIISGGGNGNNTGESNLFIDINLDILNNGKFGSSKKKMIKDNSFLYDGA